MIRRAERYIMAVLPACLVIPAACSNGAFPNASNNPPKLNVSFLFTPPNDSGYKEQAFVDIPLGDMRKLVFNLKPSVTVTGMILSKDNLYSGMAAGLTFTPRASIPGLNPVPATASSRKNLKTGAVMPYTIELTAGTYDILVTPDNPSLPPVRFQKVDIARAGEEENLDIHYPRSSELNHLTGKVVLSGADGIELGGLMVKAYDLELGKASTSAVTGGNDGKGGDFSLAFPPGPGTYTLRVWSPEGVGSKERLYFPTVEFYDAIVFKESPESKAAPSNSIIGAVFTVPAGLSNQPIKVKGRVTSQDSGSALKDVTVRYSADMLVQSDELRASFDASTKSDENGDYDLEILPGASYRIMFIPPPGSDRRSTEITKHIEAPKDGGPLVIDAKLGEKSRLFVTLVEADTGVDLHLEGGDEILVKARKIAGLGEQEYVTAWADENGKCSLPLDAGIYDIIVLPSPSTRFSGTVLRGHLHTGESDDSVVLPLHYGSEICGKVLNEYGSPIGPTRIQVFDSPPDDNPAELIAEAVDQGFSGGDGAFCILVPRASDTAGDSDVTARNTTHPSDIESAAPQD